jgi:hypothetical protein
MMISQRYVALTDSITHGNEVEEQAVLAPHFSDRAKLKLVVYQYDPLTVLVQKISSQGNQLVVHAQYVGIGKRHENTVDRWILVDGTWKLVARDRGAV